MSSQGYVGINTISHSYEPYFDVGSYPYKPYYPAAGIFNTSLEDYYKTNKFPHIFDFTKTTVDATSITFPKPKCSIGDLLVVFSLIEDPSSVVPYTGFVTQIDDQDSNREFVLLTREVDGTEGSNFTFTNDSVRDWTVICLTVRGNGITNFYINTDFGTSSGFPLLSNTPEQKLLYLFCTSTYLSNTTWGYTQDYNNIIVQETTNNSLQVGALYYKRSELRSTFGLARVGGSSIGNKTMCIIFYQD